jgi:peptide deformylase
MGRLLQIAQLGRPILRRQAEKVEDLSDPDIQSLLDDMFETLADANGLGLAAPQVYRSLQIFILCSRPSPVYPNAPEIRAKEIINPEIIAHSEEKEKGWEGCLSLPGIRGFVPRSKHITVRYLYTTSCNYAHVKY